MKILLPKAKKSLITVMGYSLLTLPLMSAAVELEEVAVIGTRTETSLADLPSSISVLNAEQLNALSAAHIQEALSQIPGVSYHRGNGQESLPAIRSAVLTGAGACGNVLILEEAIPVRAAGFCNVNELFDTHFDQAARLEIVRGAGTAFYGSNALLGSINAHLPADGSNRLSLELGANQFKRAKLAFGYGQPRNSTGSSFGSLYLTASDDEGYRADSGYSQQKLSWRHQAKVNNWLLEAGATTTHLDQETAGFVVGLDSYRDPVLRELNPNPEAFRKSESFRAWAGFTKEQGSKTITIRPYVRFSEMDFLQHFLPGDPLEQNEQQGVGLQSSVKVDASESLAWTVGFDGELTSAKLLQTQDAPTQGSAFLRNTIPAGTHYDYSVDARQLALFGHLNWQPSDMVQVLAGLRLENMHYDYTNNGLDGRSKDNGEACGFGGCRYSRPSSRTDSFTHLSPKVEVKLRPSESIEWHVSIADTFRAPQATELYRLQRAQQEADLDEVKARHIQVGFVWRTNRASLHITAYDIAQSNVIIRDSDFFNIDGQKIDSQGLELQTHLVFNPQLSARVVASYASHEYASDQIIGDTNINGNTVDTAPKSVASAFLRWQPESALSAELELKHVSSYFLEPQNRFEYPGHSVWNLRTSYQVNNALKASLKFMNISNKFYAERADYTGFTGHRYFPSLPRSLYGELSWSF